MKTPPRVVGWAWMEGRTTKPHYLPKNGTGAFACGRYGFFDASDAGPQPYSYTKPCARCWRSYKAEGGTWVLDAAGCPVPGENGKVSTLPESK